METSVTTGTKCARCDKVAINFCSSCHHCFEYCTHNQTARCRKAFLKWVRNIEHDLDELVAQGFAPDVEVVL